MGYEVNILTIFQSLGLTIFFVGLIGLERQHRHKIAGMTTHVLVALGASSLAIVQEIMVYDTIQFAAENPDLVGIIIIERQRIIAQVIAGVGFLGTGAILKTKSNVFGLTTASTLWISAIIGIIFGLGQYSLGIAVSILALITLTFVKRVLIKAFPGPQVEEDSNDED